MNRLQQYLLQGLGRYGAYLELFPDPAAAASMRRPRVLLLNRRHYFETLRMFPFTGVKEIRAAVSMDQSAYGPFESGTVLLRRVALTGEGAHVNLWMLDPALEPLLDVWRPWFVVPETALLALEPTATARLMAIQREQDWLLAFVSAEGAVQSMTAQNADTDLVRFRRSLGYTARDTPVEHLMTPDWPAPLWEHWARLRWSSLTPFARRQPLQINRRALIGGLAGLITLGLLQTGISSTLLWRQRSHLQTVEQTLGQELGAVLETRLQLDSGAAEYARLVQPLNDYAPLYPFLQQLHTLLPFDTELTQITVSGAHTELRGHAPSAAAVLAALGQHPDISGAQFSSPVRKDPRSNLDRFHIGFSHKP